MNAQPQPYKVLARAYRPQNFSQLIGQEALVRTLTNAITSGRIAHAYVLTGVRGVGKTTTARIIARALNYTGADGTAGPTAGPTDDCAQCRMIAEDRHPDVLEIDAASNTGVDNMRQIIDGVRYAPTSARYKVYIIDEVHMLSQSAFNALLKTLEEPPAHAIFIFATTEIRKVPVTILSRCQRFDLRRVDRDVLGAHFRSIAAQEKVSCDDAALDLIARAADGSVRDGLSLLDRAIALGNGQVDAALVQSMLGLTDRSQIIDLFLSAIGGESAAALAAADALRAHGADALTVAQDLLSLAHVLTRLKAVPGNSDFLRGDFARADADRLDTAARGASVPALNKAWQILLKGISEIQQAPDPMAALDMTLIRLAYAAGLPDPADLIKRLDNDRDSALPSGGPALSGGGAAASSPPPLMRAVAGGGQARAAAMPAPQPAGDISMAQLATFDDAITALEQNGSMILASQVVHHAHLVSFAPGRIELRPAQVAPARMAPDLAAALSALSGQRWIVSLSNQEGAPTRAQQKAQAQQEVVSAIRNEPVVKAVFDVFPDASLYEIHDTDMGVIKP